MDGATITPHNNKNIVHKNENLDLAFLISNESRLRFNYRTKFEIEFLNQDYLRSVSFMARNPGGRWCTYSTYIYGKKARFYCYNKMKLN